MGIPSYYKRLIDSVTGLISYTHPGKIDWLWMDFNCLIYHCLHKPGMKEIPYEDKDIWERHLLDEVIAYTRKIVGEVKPSKGVYIAIDGVVPMAKMKQQRLRRFKSAWLAQNEPASTGGDNKEKWDTNAITPGTAFMTKLRLRLEEEAKRQKKWQISSSDEPGEGEHKIMAQWRKRQSSTEENYAVYGLDADLVVLSLLTRGINNVWLFREEVESGVIVRNAEGDERYTWFNINELERNIVNTIGDKMQDYCFAMSFLGNDFLPTSLSFKMREDGHETLLKILSNSKEGLINPSDGQINKNGVVELFKVLAADEDTRILKSVLKKMQMGKTAREVPVGDNMWAIWKNADRVLLGEGRGLSSKWPDMYKEWCSGNKDLAIKTYLYGVQWNWAYYNGEDVCYNWYYPWHLPPLWKWLEREESFPEFPGTVGVRGGDIKPIEQLALVLPLESWNLLGRSGKERLLPVHAPWLFPKKYGFFSLGKRWFWECEPEIPVPSIRELKRIVSAIL